MANSSFEAGVVAFKAGQTEHDNPYICGKTKLGNDKLSEGGEDWLAGFRSGVVRVASKEELAKASQYDVSRFRRKSNRFYRS